MTIQQKKVSWEESWMQKTLKPWEIIAEICIYAALAKG